MAHIINHHVKTEEELEKENVRPSLASIHSPNEHLRLTPSVYS
jgi:hypothetical protein